MKRGLYFILIIFTVVAESQAYDLVTIQAYIDKYKAIAISNEKEYGIPAPIILAQGILESGAGTSGLTRASNNHFGIKAGLKWKGRVHQAWDDEPQKSRFRCYATAAESFEDYARLLTTNSCYRDLFKINIFDYRGWAHGLKKAGYATAPHYAQALIGIIDQYKLYELNGGAKLKPGKTVVISRQINVDRPVIEEEYIIDESEVSDEQTMMNEAASNYAVLINNIHCTVIQPGETLASISRKYDISSSQLLKFNELYSENQVREGSIIFFDKKKKKYGGAQDVYIVRKNETLYDISQKFGVQIHSLAKLNKMSEYEALSEGARILLK